LTLFSNKDDTKNAFNNDGSFLENFKKITQQAKLQATGNQNQIESPNTK
jgi:hypothetical protein